MEDNKQPLTITMLDYIQNFLKIKSKDGRVIDFKLNKPQLKLYHLIQKMKREGKPVRIIILKARQMGFSTLVEAIMFACCALQENVKAGVITHRDDATNNLLSMFKFYLANLPDEFKPQIKSTNAKEVIFNTQDNKGLNSQIACMTATNDGVGRGATYQLLHISEFAFWLCNKNATYSDLMQAVPSTPNSMVFIESTANGYDEFRDFWYRTVNKENDYEALFVAWWEMDEYRREYTGFELTEEEKELKKQYNLDNEQLAWRRYTIANGCAGDINKFHQEYPSNPEEAFISSGNCVFDVNKLQERLHQLQNVPFKKGTFKYDYVYDKTLGYNGEMTVRNPQWVDDKQGEIWIYKEVEQGVPYVIGCDTSGEGSDYSVCQVLDNRTGEQVLKYKTQADTTLFMRMTMAIAIHYNIALVGVETNFEPSAVKILQRMGYEHQYVREVQDLITNSVKDSFGFRTTTITRPILIQTLLDLVRDNASLINDIETINEMLKFVNIYDIERRTSKAQAIKGEHDDHVMSLGIALMMYSSEQQSHFKDQSVVEQRPLNWIEESMKKDKKKGGTSKWYV